MATLDITSSMGINMLESTISDLLNGIAYDRTSTLVRVWYDVDEYDEFTGHGFAYDGDGVPVAGTVTRYKYVFGGVTRVTLSDASIAATTIVSYARTGNTTGLFQLILSGADTLTGNAGADGLYGYGGNDKLYGKGAGDTLNGGSGDDLLDGGTGNDYLYGGTGNDTFKVDALGDQVIEYAGQGTDKVISSISYTLGGNVENLSLIGTATNGFGNTLDNSIRGNAADNTLRGYEGNDVLRGFGGNDVLNGGVGDDKMYGGTGDDGYLVVTSGDKVVEHAGQGHDTVLSLISYKLTANVEDLALAEGSAVQALGNGRPNVIEGNALANTVKGFGNNDVLWGHGGNDLINGGSGRDTLLGGAGSDVLLGGIGADLLVGGTGKDTLKGGDHADKLRGDGGADHLNGGNGADRFIYVNASQGGDTIADFSRAQGDKVQVNSANFGSIETGGLRAKYFLSNTNGVAMDANDYFVFSTKNNILFYDADGSGAGARVKIATFTNGFLMERTDIVVV